MTDAITNSMIGVINSIPDQILQPEERSRWIELLLMEPIESQNIDVLLTSQQALASNYASLLAILKTRLATFQAIIAPIRITVENEAEMLSGKKLTNDKRDAVVAADPRCSGWYYQISVTDSLIEQVKIRLNNIEQRRWLLVQKASSARDIERHNY